jgi:hypothetical protein
MKKPPQKSFARLLSAVTLVAVLLVQFIPIPTASAAQITARSLTLQAGASDGGSKAGGVVNHLFNFTLPGGSNVGSIKFQYCTTAAAVTNGLDCDVPTGLDTTTATLGTQTGAAGFSIVTNTADAPNGTVYLTRPAASVSASQVVSYQLQSVKNPTVKNQTFYVRISTFASTDTTGSATDAGTVTASTADRILIDGTMPESLVFCTGATVTTTSGVPDCNTATDGLVSFNQLFSATDTATAHSQMAASTNAGFGYVITVNGTTLTSGSNTIAGMNASGLGVHGIAQFGMNLKANTTLTSTTAVGSEVAPVADGTTYKGQALAGYNTVDNFKFTPSDPIADSGNGGVGGTDAQIFTASYIVNVPGNQPAGTYTTTLTYICTPKF